ncbi:MAG: GNAT family N-acetyltransferase [Fimbriimonadaceae bacterium]|nr:GNAT family N-acetyltransferase [Fimbriimonadaceae bacterium]
MSPEFNLRDVSPEDIAVFFKQQAAPEVFLMTGIQPRDERAFFDHWSKVMSDSTVIVRTITVGDEVAGFTVSFNRIGVREVGYWLGREYWGKGIATAALKEFLLLLIDERPVYARTAKKNTASVRVLEKCGFVVADQAEGFVDESGQPIEGLHMRLDA